MPIPDPSRACGPCTLCCKLFRIPELEKPAGRWCKECQPGKGCGAYDQRPQTCRDFLCGWIQDGAIPDEWRPDRSKMVISTSPATGFWHVQVDPGAPLAWKKAPYHAQLKAWAAAFQPHGILVLVFVNSDAHLILPDADVALGPMRPDENFSVKRVMSATGPAYEVVRT